MIYFFKRFWAIFLFVPALPIFYYLWKYIPRRNDSYDLYLKIKTFDIQPQAAKNSIAEAKTAEDSLFWLATYITSQSRIRSEICLPEILEELRLATKINNLFYTVEALRYLSSFPEYKEETSLKRFQGISETSADPFIKALCYSAISQHMFINGNKVDQVYWLMKTMETLKRDAPYAELMILNTQLRLNRILVKINAHDQVKRNFFDKKKWPDLVKTNDVTMLDYFIAVGKYDSARTLLSKYTTNSYDAKLWTDYYTKVGKMDSLEIYLEKEINRWNPEVNYVGVPLRELARIKIANGELEPAKRIVNRLISEADEKWHYRDKAIGLNLLAQIFLEQHKYDSCRIVLDRAKKLTLEKNFFDILATAYQIESKFFKQIGEHTHELESSIKYLLYRKKADSLSNPLGIQELVLKDNYNKQSEILSLLTKQKRDERIVLITIAILALIITTSFYANKVLLKRQRELNEKLTQTDTLKSRFFAYISHEFRTPITLLLSPLEEQVKKAKPEQMEVFALMQRNANRLLELVNQLLDLSKLDAGKMKLQIKYQRVDQEVKAVVAAFDSLAEYKQVSFEKNILLNETAIWCDIDAIEKIINNLLSNAFKFTPEKGSIRLEIKQLDERLVILVSDSGNGIPELNRSEIFSPFYQILQTRDSLQQGTGLGLSLVHELVKLYRGKIDLKTEENVGTQFTVEIPTNPAIFPPGNLSESKTKKAHTLSRSMDDQANEAISEELVGGKEIVLIVEDHDDMRKYMASLLSMEYDVLLAKDGEEGIGLALKSLPNLILSDLMMPKIDGIQLTRQIKEDERTSHIPVILLTAKNELKSKLDGLNSGADDYLAKPFSNEELKVRIRNLIQQRKKLATKFNERILVLPTQGEELSLDEKFLIRVRKVVESNMLEVSFGVEKMAEEMGLSRTHLNRKMKALTNLSPNEFIRDLRLNKAAQMISQKTDTISQIAYSVGFNDQSYFTKCFKNKFNKSPSEYGKI